MQLPPPKAPCARILIPPLPLPPPPLSGPPQEALLTAPILEVPPILRARFCHTVHFKGGTLSLNNLSKEAQAQQIALLTPTVDLQSVLPHGISCHPTAPRAQLTYCLVLIVAVRGAHYWVYLSTGQPGLAPGDARARWVVLNDGYVRLVGDGSLEEVKQAMMENVSAASNNEVLRQRPAMAFYEVAAGTHPLARRSALVQRIVAAQERGQQPSEGDVWALRAATARMAGAGGQQAAAGVAQVALPPAVMAAATACRSMVPAAAQAVVSPAARVMPPVMAHALMAREAVAAAAPVASAAVWGRVVGGQAGVWPSGVAALAGQLGACAPAVVGMESQRVQVSAFWGAGVDGCEAKCIGGWMRGWLLLVARVTIDLSVMLGTG